MSLREDREMPLYKPWCKMVNEKTKIIIEIREKLMQSEKDFDNFYMEKYNNARK